MHQQTLGEDTLKTAQDVKKQILEKITVWRFTRQMKEHKSFTCWVL